MEIFEPFGSADGIGNMLSEKPLLCIRIDGFAIILPNGCASF